MNKNRIKLLEQFIEEEPENPFNTYALAMEYYDVDSKAALRLLSSLQRQHPSYLPAYYQLANLLREEENRERADYIFKIGIKLAEELNDTKTHSELLSCYQNFLFEKD